MNKSRIAVGAVAVSFMAATACFAANAQIGSWKLNNAKSKLPAGRGKKNNAVYTEEGGKNKVTNDGKDKGGKPAQHGWVGKVERKTHPNQTTSGTTDHGYREQNTT